jgi:hemoglobin
MFRTSLLATALVLGLSACASMYDTPAVAEKAPVKAALKDGEIPLPAGYASWPVFLKDIQRPDIKQVRDIYVNTTGTTAKAGQPFPNGTQFVMELHSVKLDAEGKPALDADGKLVKDKLSKVFVMEKGEGWGASAPEGLKTGDWVYASYDAAGKNQGAETQACRACHVPHAAKDWVPRYDEYFQKRAAWHTAPLAMLSTDEIAASRVLP